ncbi:MAG: site-2 protease family protein [Cyanobacteria bacterium P01_C01_bin.89]
MRSGIRVGSVLGIPLLIDPSWFLIITLFAFVNSMEWQNRFPEWSMLLTWGIGLVVALLLFASVLLHELGHSAVAISQGIKVNSITLFMFGGMAAIDSESKTPMRAFAVAIAGPAVSILLFGMLFGFNTFLVEGSPLSIVVGNLARINLVLGTFNLIPGLPLDGGQILKAIVWKITGSRYKGTHWAAQTGLALGWLAIAFGLFTTFNGGGGGLWIALLGWFCARNASNYDRVTSFQEALVGLKVGDAVAREFRVVDGRSTLREFVDQYLLREERPVFFAASDGRYQGLVRPEELQTIERSLWEQKRIGDIAIPLDQLPTVTESTPLVKVVRRLEDEGLPRMVVLTPAGAVSGVVDRADAVKAMAKSMKLPLSDADFARLKSEGGYPAGLNLAAIASTIPEG